MRINIGKFGVGAADKLNAALDIVNGRVLDWAAGDACKINIRSEGLALGWLDSGAERTSAPRLVVLRRSVARHGRSKLAKAALAEAKSARGQP